MDYKFIIKNATITFNDATKYYFDTIRCNQISSCPYNVLALYRNGPFWAIFFAWGLTTLDSPLEENFEEIVLSGEIYNYPEGMMSDHLFYNEVVLRRREDGIVEFSAFDEIHECEDRLQETAHFYQLDKEENILKKCEFGLEYFYDNNLHRWESVGLGILECTDAG